MPVNLGELVNAIGDRMTEIRSLSDGRREQARAGEDLVRELRELDLDGLTSRLPPEPRGALPIPEGGEAPGEWRFIRPFDGEFIDMVSARRWAREVLTGRSVGAVDGSQIYPGNELSIPFGLVNIGWYINHHDGTFTRDHSSRLLLPDDLGYNPESGVNLLREEGEIRKLRELIHEAGERDLLLLDGSLVLSFALHVYDTTRDRYIRGILSLLKTVDHEKGGLFAAYVDNSRATDLAAMLAPLLEERGIVDGSGSGDREGRVMGIPQDTVLLDRSLSWGDRTSAFVCARDDILQLYTDEEGTDRSRDILFFYLKTSHGRVARVEFPRRIAREGRVEELADVVRAQAIVGGGYAHALDRAHHEANVSMADRERFLKLLLTIARRNDLELGASLKSVKKR
jgi:hypothetical protein